MTYQCKSCKRIYSKWQGQCSECGEWNSLEILKETQKASRYKSSIDTLPIDLKSLNKVLKTTKLLSRKTSGIAALDNLLGGGFVEGQTILLAGEPGVGKSTLALQFSGTSKLKTTYISGEETEEQVASRAKRV